MAFLAKKNFYDNAVVRKHNSSDGPGRKKSARVGLHKKYRSGFFGPKKKRLGLAIFKYRVLAYATW